MWGNKLRPKIPPIIAVVVVASVVVGGAAAAPESEIAKLTASDAAASDHFGFSVSVSGDTAVVGAQRDIPSGSAYIFVRDEGGVDNWGRWRSSRPVTPG